MSTKRKKILCIMTAVFLAIAIGIFVYWLLWGRFHEYTNDAYVSGNLIYVTPQVSGIVTSICVDNTEFAQEGDLAIELDPIDYEIALNASKADLASTIRDVAELFLQAKQALAMIDVAKTQFIQTSQDFERRTELVNSGSVSKEDFDHAENALLGAYFSLVSAEANYLSLFAQVGNTSIQEHPRVQKAVEDVKNAWIQRRRCSVKVPAGGLIAERSVQVGQRVTQGQSLFAVIPLEQMWIEANFKEVQIGKMQIGQKVSLNSDVYGSKAPYEGYIIGIGGGTGSVFSILPPQNATGNWIKIVQRVPVRISLDAKELKKAPLRLGLSMEATVNIRDIGHKSVPFPISPRSLYQTWIFDSEEEGLQDVIQTIFTANLPSIDLSQLDLAEGLTSP
ncbi:MAG: HlyD family efflux transporter periplasmic adaptor subunit [Rhabdochlamydiaceae bacterium]|nr:HlyD family efflux transporter periplasmic adaptor subunit [Rhabdochlamydiaceae bacterium]